MPLKLPPGLGAPSSSSELSRANDEMDKWTNPELELGAPRGRPTPVNFGF